MTGPLGVPISQANPITGAATSGVGQNFAKGQMLSSAAGAFAVSGSIRAAHAVVKWVRGPLGWPTGDQTCDASDNCTRTFQGRVINSTGANSVIAIQSQEFLLATEPVAEC